MPHFKYSGKGLTLKCPYWVCCNMYILMFAAILFMQEICHKLNLLCSCFSLDETGLTDVGATHLGCVLKAEGCRIQKLR